MPAEWQANIKQGLCWCGLPKEEFQKGMKVYCSKEHTRRTAGCDSLSNLDQGLHRDATKEEGIIAMTDPYFDSLLGILGRFKVFTKPAKERDLENRLIEYLQRQDIPVNRQETSHHGRYDVVVIHEGKRYLIELKQFADRSCVDQLDHYANAADGLILVCWKASKGLRIVFAIEKPRAKIPLALVEVKRNCSFV